MSHSLSARSGTQRLLPLSQEDSNMPKQLQEEEDRKTAEKSQVRDAAKDQIGHGEQFD
jgi:hypothetical protein